MNTVARTLCSCVKQVLFLLPAVILAAPQINIIEGSRPGTHSWGPIDQGNISGNLSVLLDNSFLPNYGSNGSYGANVTFNGSYGANFTTVNFASLTLGGNSYSITSNAIPGVIPPGEVRADGNVTYNGTLNNGIGGIYNGSGSIIVISDNAILNNSNNTSGSGIYNNGSSGSFTQNNPGINVNGIFTGNSSWSMGFRTENGICIVKDDATFTYSDNNEDRSGMWQVFASEGLGSTLTVSMAYPILDEAGNVVGFHDKQGFIVVTESAFESGIHTQFQSSSTNNSASLSATSGGLASNLSKSGSGIFNTGMLLTSGDSIVNLENLVINESDPSIHNISGLVYNLSIADINGSLDLSGCLTAGCGNLEFASWNLLFDTSNLSLDWYDGWVILENQTPLQFEIIPAPPIPPTYPVSSSSGSLTMTLNNGWYGDVDPLLPDHESYPGIVVPSVTNMTRWIGSSNKAWDKAANWDGGIPNENTEYTLIDSSSSLIEITELDTNPGGDLYIALSTESNAVLNMDNSSLRYPGIINISHLGNTHLSLDASHLYSDTSIRIAEAGNATVFLSEGPGIGASGNIHIAKSSFGRASFFIDGSSLASLSGNISIAEEGDVYMSVNEARIWAEGIQMADKGTANLSLSNTIFSANTSLCIAEEGEAILTLHDSGIEQNSGNTSIATKGHALIHASNSTLQFPGDTRIGSAKDFTPYDAHVEITLLNESKLNVGGTLRIANGGNTLLSLNASQVRIKKDAHMAENGNLSINMENSAIITETAFNIAGSGNATILMDTSTLMTTGQRSMYGYSDIAYSGNTSIQASQTRLLFGEALHIATVASSHAELFLGNDTHLIAEDEMILASGGRLLLTLEDSLIHSGGIMDIASKGNATLTLINSTLSTNAVVSSDIFKGTSSLIADQGHAEIFANNSVLDYKNPVIIASQIRSGYNGRASASITLTNRSLFSAPALLLSFNNDQTTIDVDDSTLYAPNIVASDNATIILKNNGGLGFSYVDKIPYRFGKPTNSVPLIVVDDGSLVANPEGTDTAFIRNSTIVVDPGQLYFHTYNNLSVASNTIFNGNGSLQLVGDGALMLASSCIALDVVDIAEFGGSKALLLIDGYSLLSAKNLNVHDSISLDNGGLALADKLSLGDSSAMIFHLGSSPLQHPRIVAGDAEITGNPSVILDCANFERPLASPLTLDLLSVKNLSASGTVRFSTINHDPAIYDISLRWNEPTQTLQAVIRDLRASSQVDLRNQEKLLDYAFGENQIARLFDLTPGSLSYKYPYVSRENDKLRISFIPARSELIYEVQQSTDMTEWTTISKFQGGIDTGIYVESTELLSETPNLFLRVKVSPQSQ